MSKRGSPGKKSARQKSSLTSLDVATAAFWSYDHGYLQVLAEGPPLSERLRKLADGERLESCAQLLLLCPSDGQVPEDAARLDEGRLVSIGRSDAFTSPVAGSRSRQYGAHAVFRVVAQDGRQRLVAAEAVSSLRTLRTVAEAMSRCQRAMPALNTPTLVAQFVSALRRTVQEDDRLRGMVRLVEYNPGEKGALAAAIQAAAFAEAGAEQAVSAVVSALRRTVQEDDRLRGMVRLVEYNLGEKGALAAAIQAAAFAEAGAEQAVSAAPRAAEPAAPGGIGVYLAWSFVHGYLTMAAQKRDAAAELRRLAEDGELSLPLTRVVVLCPTGGGSDDWTEDITALDNQLQPLRDVSGVQLSGRSYGDLSIYRVGSGAGGACFALELATPLRTLRLGTAADELYEREARSFVTELQTLLKETPELSASYSVLAVQPGASVSDQLQQLARDDTPPRRVSCPVTQ